MIFAWDVGSSVTFAECSLLAALAEGDDVLEIGSWLGRSTIALASTAHSVMAVDWHHGDFYAGEKDTETEFRENIARYGLAERIEVVVAKIEDVDLGDRLFDGIFIDAAHDADSVRAHWQIALEHIQPDGWIAVHDYGRFDVTAVMDELVPDKYQELTESLAVYSVPR